MYLLNVVLILALWWSYSIHTLEYIYPVASTIDGLIYYIHQKTLSDLELWQYQIQTGLVNKQLYWRFMPIGFRMLPDNSGFSFIDTDRLRIKKFINRSPGTIEFNLPVHGISQVGWLNEHRCYFIAKQKNHYAIFEGDISTKELTLLHQSYQAECLCPQITTSGLFCIERHTHDRSCAIVQLPLLAATKKKVLIDCGYQQVIHFELLSDTLGFYIESMPYINQDSLTIGFICYQIFYSAQTDQWTSRSIFKFNVPKKYLIGDLRLLESYIPFLPRAKKTILYFTDIQQNQTGQYYSSIEAYDLILGQKICILKSDPNRIYFAPILSDNLLFCGQALEMPDNHSIEDAGAVELVKVNL